MANKKRFGKKRCRKPAWVTVVEQAAKFWRLAIFKLREQLEEDCITHPPERRRLQNRRLIENLHGELGSSNGAEYWGVMAYWLVCESPWQDELGYEEARQQHQAELKALGIRPEFERPQFQTKPRSAALIAELLFRLDSLACWIEAQEA